MKQAIDQFCGLIVLVLIFQNFQLGCDKGKPNTRDEKRQSDVVKITSLQTKLLALDKDGKIIDLDIDLDKLVQDEITKSSSLKFYKKSGKVGVAGKLGIIAQVGYDQINEQLHAIISANVTGGSSIPLQVDIDAVRSVSKSLKKIDNQIYRDHLAKAIVDTFRALTEQAKIIKADNATLIQALKSKELDIKMAAVRTLGERKVGKSVEPLCKVLAHEKGPLGEVVVGALTMIGHEKGADCLIQWAHRDDKRLVMIIDPLSMIGGDEAFAFLEMISSGHKNPQIRYIAEGGLQRLQRQRARKN